MALKIADRVRETTTTTGTGTINLGGAVTNFETFAANLSNSDTTYYAIVDNTNGAFEVGLGTFSTGSPNTLARTTPIASSNSNSAVNFGVGTKDVFITTPASKMAFLNASGSLISSGGTSLMEVANDTTPQLGGNLDTNSHNILIDDAHFIADENGNEQIIFQTTSSAVNQLDVTNAATGSGPTISSTGGDTNINLNLTPKGSGVVLIDGQVGIEAGIIDLKNSGSTVSKILFYCESSNAHAQTLIGAPHSETASNTLTLPSTGGNSRLVSTASTATLTNKSIDSDNNTITNIVNADIKSSAAIADTKLATISTAGKVALSALEIDGASEMGAALADADLLIVDDGAGGTEKSMLASRIPTYVFSKVSGDATVASNGALTIAAQAVENSMLADDAVGADELAANAVVNASVASGAAIEFSKMENLTASRALVSDGSGDVSAATTTSTEIGYVNGVTSAIQTQLDAKATKGFATAMAIAL
tara:strand:- start:440 stop:1876 length:1437 start_codon:yes stop_codon:yes gene_type:complete